MAEEFDRREKELIDGGDLNRENNELNRIGKQHSVDSLKKLKEISKSSIINMNTIKDIQNYVKENYDISIQGFENLSLDKNKIIFSGLDDMLRSYPDVKNSLARSAIRSATPRGRRRIAPTTGSSPIFREARSGARTIPNSRFSRRGQ